MKKEIDKEPWRVNVGNKEKRNRKRYTLAVKPFLIKWIKEKGKKRLFSSL